MVISDPEIMSQGEVESSLPQDQHFKHNASPSLGRQSSIYSLTLDEFQQRLCEGSKNFGSMNMDEFLNNIWNHEEGLSIINNSSSVTDSSSNNNEVNLLSDETSTKKPITKQPSLTRQGSLTFPILLCHKTVDEVWSEIHKNQKQGRKQTGTNVKSSDYATRQSTFGDMTLEDFLVKAGVVQENSNTPVPLPPQHYGLYQTINQPLMDNPTLVSRNPVMEMAAASGGKRNGSHHAPQFCYGIGNGGGYGSVLSTREDKTASPVSPDWIATNHCDTRENQCAMAIDRSRGRKRTLDGPVERIQRRMMKNRESAARSRFRKQAYTDELKAELSQLKEENAHLKHTLAEVETKRKQLYFEEKRESQSTVPKEKVRLQVMMRTQSLPIPSCFSRRYHIT